jgi:hypothetical protein
MVGVSFKLQKPAVQRQGDGVKRHRASRVLALKEKEGDGQKIPLPYGEKDDDGQHVTAQEGVKGGPNGEPSNGEMGSANIGFAKAGSDKDEERESLDDGLPRFGGSQRPVSWQRLD